MSDLKHGGPAFPVQCVWWHNGMTLRDYFAAAALTGLASGGNFPSVEAAVEIAYKLADAMIAAKDK